MTDTPKTTSDKRDTMLTNAIKNGTETIKDLAPALAAGSCSEDKPAKQKIASYNAIPVTSETFVDGKLLPAFVLKLNGVDTPPRIGDKVCFKFGRKAFNGTVNSTNKQGVITLNLT